MARSLTVHSTFQQLWEYPWKIATLLTVCQDTRTPDKSSDYLSPVKLLLVCLLACLLVVLLLLILFIYLLIFVSMTKKSSGERMEYEMIGMYKLRKVFTHLLENWFRERCSDMEMTVILWRHHMPTSTCYCHTPFCMNNINKLKCLDPSRHQTSVNLNNAMKLVTDHTLLCRLPVSRQTPPQEDAN